jgi:hypothetical protein
MSLLWCPLKGCVLEAFNISMVTILHHNVKGALVSYLPPSNHELLTKICDKEITKFLKDISFQCNRTIKSRKKSTTKMYFKSKVVEMEIFVFKKKL